MQAQGKEKCVSQGPQVLFPGESTWRSTACSREETNAHAFEKMPTPLMLRLGEHCVLQRRKAHPDALLVEAPIQKHLKVPVGVRWGGCQAAGEGNEREEGQRAPRISGGAPRLKKLLRCFSQLTLCLAGPSVRMASIRQGPHCQNFQQPSV